MKIIEQGHQIIQYTPNMLKVIEAAGRTCYKSEKKITDESAVDFVNMIIEKKHESVLEHATITVRFVTNRGVTHELVRHRLCSYSQESTRYVQYNDIEFIKPVWWNDWSKDQQDTWIKSMQSSEDSYKALIASGVETQKAREVLPNSLKTEIVVTANVREWRHIFHSRCSTAAHPQIRTLMLDCLADFKKQFPVLFEINF